MVMQFFIPRRIKTGGLTKMKFSPISASARLLAFLTIPLLTVGIVAQPAVDGTTNDASYGGQVAVQTTQTDFGDNADAAPDVNGSGSELDNISLFSNGTHLYVALAGNMQTNGNFISIWIDTDNNRKTGAQVVPSNLFTFAEGAQLPLGAELVLTPNAGGPGQTAYLNVHLFNADGSSRSSEFIGSVAGSAGNPTTGTITGNVDGTSYSFPIAFDNSNTGGVATGTGAANMTNAAAVTTGLEIQIPRTLLDDAQGSAVSGDIAMFAAISGGSFFSNQTLPGLGTPQGNLGNAPEMTGLQNPYIVHTLNSAGGSIAQPVLVDLTATGGANGTTWADAFTTIQAGVSDANALNEAVWVADGTYNLTSDINMQPGVEVFGGFEGDGGAEETLFSQRDFDTNVAIIGAGTNDTIVINSDNDSTVDGFTLTQSGSFTESLINVVLSQNVDIRNIAVPDIEVFPLSGIFTAFDAEVVFESIHTGDPDGDSTGSVFDFGPDSTVLINNSVITAGTAASTLITQFTNNVDLEVTNSVFANCTTGISVNDASTTTTLRNVTMNNCVSAALVVSGNATLEAYNTILSNSGIGAQETPSGGVITLNHCLLFNNTNDFQNTSGTNTNGAANVNAIGSNTNNIDGNPNYVNAASDDYSLNTGSSAVDQGNDAQATTTDIAGNARNDNPNFTNGPGGFSDIGAYEADVSLLVPVELSSFMAE
jgi:hypothetical protein